MVNFFGPAGQTSILGHAKQLLCDLANERRTAGDRPIIFVAHSLGGLVVKDALYQSHSETHNDRLARIKRCTIGVIFAGTPHQGADKARWATIAGHLTRLVLKNPNTSLTEALTRGADTLERLQIDFSRILCGLPVYTFLEELAFPGNGIIVDRASAVIGFPHEVTQVIPADHEMMVKFDRSEDTGYRRIKDAILNLIEDWEKRTEPVQAGKIYRLSVPDGAMLTVLNDIGDVKLQRWENTNSQKWKVEAINGYHGFKNMSSARFLGVNYLGYVGCGAYNALDSEKFSFERVENGHQFAVSWMWSQRFLVQPHEADYLEVSRDIGRATPITITEWVEVESPRG